MEDALTFRRMTAGQWVSNIILLFGTAVMLLPFLYMIGTSFKPPPEVIAWPPTLIPHAHAGRTTPHSQPGRRFRGSLPTA